MPAPRLPWFKVWHEALSHKKIALLPDPVFRTWVHIVSAGARQAERGQFASARHAALASGRPVTHIRQLVKQGLIDEAADGVLRVHDLADWQDKSPSDFTRSARRQEPAKGRTKVGQGSDTNPVPFKKEREKEIQTETEKEMEMTLPASSERSPAGRLVPAGESGLTALPREKTNGHVAQGEGTDLETLCEAFEQRGLKRPTFLGFEARDARALLEHFGSDVIAACWQDYASGEYGDDFDRKRLSFGYLTKQNRVGNWQREREAAEAEPAVDPRLEVIRA